MLNTCSKYGVRELNIVKNSNYKIRNLIVLDAYRNYKKLILVNSIRQLYTGITGGKYRSIQLRKLYTVRKLDNGQYIQD